MPANNKSYENGKIYKIWSLDTDKIYIGSTCDTLSNRFSKHKSKYKSWKNEGGQFCSIFNLFDLVGVDNCKIDIEHNFACNNKTELNKEEGRLQRLYKDMIVNKVQAGRTMKEYRQEHKEEAKEYNKQYRQDHKEEIAEKAKEYRQNHKEEIAEKAKEYHQEHKQEINQKTKQKHTCECGNIYSHSCKARHLKSNKHQKYIQSSLS